MRILVTGNQGYVGPVLGAHLRGTLPEATLVGLDAGLFAGCLLDPTEWPDRSYHLQRHGDVRDVVEADLEGISAVVHLAAVSNDPMGKSFEGPTRDINHLASVRLAHLAKAAGVRRFVLASSCSVYGAGPDAPRTESDEVAPLTAYARSKVDAEAALRPLADERFQVTCLRFGTACGLSARLRLDLVLNDFVASAVSSGTIRILSDGTPWRPLIHVKDMARALEWGLRRLDQDGGNYLVVNTGSDDWNYQIRDLAAAVADELRSRVELNAAAAPDARSYRVDFSLYRRLAPDYLPKSTLRAAVAELGTALRSIGFDQPGFRDGNWIRLKVLERLCERGALGSDLRWR